MKTFCVYAHRALSLIFLTLQLFFIRNTKRHVLFNMASMMSIAKRAGQKRKLYQTKVNETEPEGTRISSALSTVNTFSNSARKVQPRDRKLGTPVTISAAVKAEQLIVIKALIECIGSRLSQEVRFLF